MTSTSITETTRTLIPAGISDPQVLRRLDQAIELRIQCLNTSADLTNTIKYFNESRAEFMQCAGARDCRESQASLKVLDEKLKGDAQALRLQLDKLRDLHTRLSQIDAELMQRAQGQTGGNAQDFQLILGSVDRTAIPVDAPDDESQSDDEELPPLLEQYFDALGDVKLLRERLNQELPFEQAERRVDRNRRIDQDLAVSLTDEEFESSCREEREQLEAGLSARIQRAQVLHAKCLSEGLDPDPLRYTRASEIQSSRRPRSGVERWLEVLTTADSSSMFPASPEISSVADSLALPDISQVMNIATLSDSGRGLPEDMAADERYQDTAVMAGNNLNEVDTMSHGDTITRRTMLEMEPANTRVSRLSPIATPFTPAIQRLPEPPPDDRHYADPWVRHTLEPPHTRVTGQPVSYSQRSTQAPGQQQWQYSAGAHDSVIGIQ